MTSLSSALARPNPHHVAPRKLAFSRAPSWKIQFTIFLCFSFTFPSHTPSLQPTNWIEPRPPRPDRLVWLASSTFNEHAKQTLTLKARAGGEKKNQEKFSRLIFRFGDGVDVSDSRQTASKCHHLNVTKFTVNFTVAWKSLAQKHHTAL